jgi:hypothetical protein
MVVLLYPSELDWIVADSKEQKKKVQKWKQNLLKNEKKLSYCSFPFSHNEFYNSLKSKKHRKKNEISF